jgi:hypothetical protein
MHYFYIYFLLLKLPDSDFSNLWSETESSKINHSVIQSSLFF